MDSIMSATPVQAAARATAGWSGYDGPMTARAMDGKAQAGLISAELAARVTALASQGVRPGLGTILVGDDPASRSYVAGKHRDCAKVGIASIQVELPASVSQAGLLEAIAALNADAGCTGFIVQLPLPAHLDPGAALAAIDPAKDADGLHPVNLGKLVLGQPGPLPCTPRAIVELLRAYDVRLDGAVVAVIGRGTTAGRPLGLLLAGRTVNATVIACHTGTRDLASYTRQADVVVAAAGRPHLVTADMVRAGAVVVDVGVARVDGHPVGDVAPGVWDVAALVSPNPGGVGPMTRVMLLTSVVEAAEAAVGGPGAR